jgi:predicted Kef-type K+ transport protein
VAMSSTVIVARMLSDRFELHSRSGRQTMGVLLFQDLAVAPLPDPAAGAGRLRRRPVAFARRWPRRRPWPCSTLLVWLGQNG